ncbi:hypothetical protein [Luteimonas sp. gir]|uniref:hypothetical protein n=1 Tax=Luteimonas sp. gir TaxID=3127960 RepID=UPI003075B85C
MTSKILCSAILAMAFSGAPIASASPSVESASMIVQDLQNYAEVRNLTLRDIKVSRKSAAGLEAGINSESCTVTATVSIPGGTGVEVSATAPTCTQAMNMLKELISEMSPVS